MVNTLRITISKEPKEIELSSSRNSTITKIPSKGALELEWRSELNRIGARGLGLYMPTQLNQSLDMGCSGQGVVTLDEQLSSAHAKAWK